MHLTVLCLLAIVDSPPSAIGVSPAPTHAAALAESEKDSRTPAQRKINSQLLYEIYRRRGQDKEKGVPPGDTGVKVDKRGRALVDVRAEVTPALQRKIRALGGTIVSVSAPGRSVVARLPLLALERLAEDPTVRFIEPAAEATTVRQP
jgi:hypothetical protein